MGYSKGQLDGEFSYLLGIDCAARYPVFGGLGFGEEGEGRNADMNIHPALKNVHVG